MNKKLWDELTGLLGCKVKQVAIHEDGVSIDLEGPAGKQFLVCKGEENVHILQEVKT